MRAIKNFLMLAILGSPLCMIATTADPAVSLPSNAAYAARLLPLFPRRPVVAPAMSTPVLPTVPWHYEARNRISSAFGWRRHPIYGDVRRHTGVDLPKPYGTPVFPAGPGTVSYAGWRNGYGWVVELKHSDGSRTLYGHLSKIYVSPGEIVKKGMLLGSVGSSGLSTGPHLHFEWRNAAGQPVDPVHYVSTVL